MRVLIVDDEPLARTALAQILAARPDVERFDSASDAIEAQERLSKHSYDVMLLDISMPGMSSFEVGRLVDEHCTSTRIVYLTMHEDQEYIQQALRSGASGYLLKDTPAPQLLDALREVHRGGRSLSPQIQKKIQSTVSTDGQSREPARVPMRRNSLTRRECEVMKLLAEGNTVKQAAAVLGVSLKTVEAHKFNLMRKLDIHNKAQLVTAAIQKKILTLPIATN